jgi:hypothetical protein
MANRYYLDAYFYYCTKSNVDNFPKDIKTPTVAVVKDKEIIYMDGRNLLEHFIINEQFLEFAEITSLLNY